MLVARVASKNNFIGVNIVFGGSGDFFRLGEANPERDEHQHAECAENAGGSQLIRKNVSAPKRDADVDKPEEHGRADEAEPRDKKNRKNQRGGESAEIIEREHMRDDVAKIVA